MRALDRALLRLLRTCGHAPAAERAVRAFSALGEHGLGWLVLGSLAALFDAGRRAAWLRVLRATAAAYAANQAIKLVVRRPRPDPPDLPPLIATRTRLSYPSAHAATSFAAARVAPVPFLHPLAAAMALSRPYLGVHWPSDTLAGALLGLAVAELVP